MVDAKSYFTNAKTHHDEASQVTDLSPDLTTCDTERRSLTHPPLARAPRDEITACDQVPHSNKYRSAGLGRTRLFHLWERESEGVWVGLWRSVSHVVRSGLRSVFCDASLRWVLALVK